MANKTLTAKVKFDTKSAEQSLGRLQKLLQNIDKVANKKTGKNGFDKQAQRALVAEQQLKKAVLQTKLAEERVTTQKQKTALAAQKVKNATDQANNSARKLGSNFNSANSSANSLLNTVKRLAATYFSLQGLKIAITASDTVTSAQNKFNNLEGGTELKTAEAMDKMYSAAQRSRSDYSAMMSNVAKSMMLAPDAFKGNTDNAIRFQEIMAKAYTVGGATAQEQHSSMYQMVQALGANKLAGDELRSVREGAPLAYREIEKFAQSINGTTESLKDMASEGKITADIVVSAIMNAGDEIDKKFENTKVTFAQAWTMIKNTGMKAFQPALEALNKMLNSEAGQKIIDGISKALIALGNILSWLINLFSMVFNWFVNNWGWLKYIVIGIIMVIVLYLGFLAAKAIATGAVMFWSWIKAFWPLLLIVAVLILITVAIAKATGSTETAVGIIVGSLAVLVAFIWNVVLMAIDSLLMFVNMIWNRVAALANFLANVFKDPIGAIIHYFGDMADIVLGIIEKIASAIDHLVGTNLAEKVSGWRGKLETVVDEAAKKYGNGKYEEIVKKIDLDTGDLGLERWGYVDAYNAGNDAGKKLANLDLGLDLDNLTLNADDYLASISEDTSDISNSMDLQDDDLEFLRKIADMEWRNEFTTAEIKVDMTNHNTVSGERDLDGIVSYLSEKLQEEMASVAYGVHY